MDRAYNLVTARPIITGTIAAGIVAVVILIVVVLYTLIKRPSPTESLSKDVGKISQINNEAGYRSIHESSVRKKTKTFAYPPIYPAALYSSLEAQRFNAQRSEWRSLLNEVNAISRPDVSDSDQKKAYINRAKMASIISGVPAETIIKRWNGRQESIREANIRLLQLRTNLSAGSHDPSIRSRSIRHMNAFYKQSWGDITLS